MHRLESRVYAGEPNEDVTYRTDPDGGASVRVLLNGVDTAPDGSFRLPGNPGEQTQLTITLFGPSGTTCVVGIAVVDGGTDGDMLVCQPHDPAPIHLYRFIVVQPRAMASIGRMLSGAAGSGGGSPSGVGDGGAGARR